MTGVPRASRLLLSDDGARAGRAPSSRRSRRRPSSSRSCCPPRSMLDTRSFGSHRPGARRGACKSGEWKVVATPGVMAGSEPVGSRADPASGGHIAWIDPQPSAASFLEFGAPRGPRHDPTLAGLRARHRSAGYMGRGLPGRPVRAGDIAGLGGCSSIRPAHSIAERGRGHQRGGSGWPMARGRDVEGEALQGPLGGAVQDSTASRGCGRFHSRVPCRRMPGVVELPARIHALERPPDDGYRSITGEWGDGTGEGPLEWAGGSATCDRDTSGPTEPHGRGHDPARTGRGRAGTRPARRRRGLVRHHRAGWEHHSIRLQLGGTPFVGATLEAAAPDGTLIPLTVEPGAIGRGMEASRRPSSPARPTRSGCGSRGCRPSSRSTRAEYRPHARDPGPRRLCPGHRGGRRVASSCFRSRASPCSRALVGRPLGGLGCAAPSHPQWVQCRGGRPHRYRRPAGDPRGYAGDPPAHRRRDRVGLRLNTEAWRDLRSVSPVIFPVHVHGPFSPVKDRQVMQDRAGLGGSRMRTRRLASRLDIAFTGWRPGSATRPDDFAGPALPTSSRRPSRALVPCGSSTHRGRGSRARSTPDGHRDRARHLGEHARQARAGPRGSKPRRPCCLASCARTFHQACPWRCGGSGSDPITCDAEERAVPLGPLDPATMAGVIEGLRIGAGSAAQAGRSSRAAR